MLLEYSNLGKTSIRDRAKFNWGRSKINFGTGLSSIGDVAKFKFTTSQKQKSQREYDFRASPFNLCNAILTY